MFKSMEITGLPYAPNTAWVDIRKRRMTADSAPKSKSNLQETVNVFTVEEMGQYLRVGRNTAYELVRCGVIRSIKIGRQIRVPRQAVDDYLSR